MGGLWGLWEEIGEAEPARRREVFRQMVSRIDLRFGKSQRGKRTECPFQSGEIYLPESGSIFGSVSRDDRRLTFLNDLTGSNLLGLALSQTWEFTADRFYALDAANQRSGTELTRLSFPPVS